MLGEVLLVRLEEAVEPGEERLGAVVGVENHGDTVELGERARTWRAPATQPMTAAFWSASFLKPLPAM